MGRHWLRQRLLIGEGQTSRVTLWRQRNKLAFPDVAVGGTGDLSASVCQCLPTSYELALRSSQYRH